MNNYNFVAEKISNIPNYEHSKIINYLNLAEGEIICEHEKLTEIPLCGNIVSSFRINNKLNYVIEPLQHEVIIGSTGTGKTTGPILAQIMATAKAGIASMFIVDPKGELYTKYSDKLKEFNYDVKVINLKDSLHSEGFNPYYEIAANYSEDLLRIGEGIQEVNENNELKYLYKNMCFNSKDALSKYIEREFQDLLDGTQTSINNIVQKLYPVEDQKQPYWERTAQIMYKSIVLELVVKQFCLDESQRTTKHHCNHINVKNVWENVDIKRGHIQDHGFFPKKSMAYKMIKNLFYNNVDTTMRNQVGFVDYIISKYNFKSFLDITMTSTIDINKFVNEKSVIFITYDDMSVISKCFLSYLISSLFETCRSIADRSETLSLNRPVLFIIDEFASLPKISDLSTFIMGSRSRGIFVHLVLQSYSQLVEKYDKDAETILSNCNNTVFLGTNDYSTVEKISKEIGRKTILSPQSVFNVDNQVVVCEEKPVVTCSDLQIFRQGDAKILRIGKHTIDGHYEKSFECDEYSCKTSKLKEYQSELYLLYNSCLYNVDNIKEDSIDDDDDDDVLF